MADAASTEDLSNETHHYQQQQEWNSSKEAASTYVSCGDLSGSSATRSLYVSGDQPRRSRPTEFDVGCFEFVDKFTTRVVNSSK